MRKRLSLVVAVLLLTWLVVPLAQAQQTGGSFGGGSFEDEPSSGSSGSSSSGSSDWGSGSSSPSFGGGGFTGTGGPTTYTGGGNSGMGCCGGSVCLLVFIGIIGVAFIMNKRKAAGAMAAGGMPMPVGGYSPMMGGVMPTPGHEMYLSALTLGIDWRARQQLQEQLTRLAQTGDTNSKEGRAVLLRETVLALRRAEMAWLYVGYRDGGPGMAAQQAQGAFQGLAGDYRARFRSELVRAGGGSMQATDAPAMKARANEGQGTVIVTVVVVARRPLRAITNPADANDIRAAVQDRGMLDAHSLVALEVIWSPAAENDRMSTAELEQNYPEVKLIDPRSIAGRVFCAYCNGPFPMELLQCPHCGAPAPKPGEPQGAGPAPLKNG